MASKKFFEERREWAARKHRILTEYLRAFLTALSGQAQKNTDNYMYYVDCFAGAGNYKLEDGSIELGSPVLAAQIARKLPYQIKCINVESQPKYFASLMESTQPYKEVVINYRGNIEEHLETILIQTQDCPAFFFLDPFGMTDIPITGLVDAIAQRKPPTDTLVRYAPIDLRRLCSAALKDPVNGPKCAAHLDNIFAGSEWRGIVARTAEPEAWDVPLLELYVSNLIHIENGSFRFAASYPIRTINDRLKYLLIFATGRRLGMKMMSSVLYSAEESFIDEKEAESIRRSKAPKAWQPSLFEAEPPPLSDEELFARKITQIAQSIIEVGKIRPSWTYENLYYKLLLSKGWFGRMTDKLFRYACKNLEQDKKLTKEAGPWGGDTKVTIKP